MNNLLNFLLHNCNPYTGCRNSTWCFWKTLPSDPRRWPWCALLQRRAVQTSSLDSIYLIRKLKCLTYKFIIQIYKINILILKYLFHFSYKLLRNWTNNTKFAYTGIHINMSSIRMNKKNLLGFEDENKVSRFYTYSIYNKNYEHSVSILVFSCYKVVRII